MIRTWTTSWGTIVTATGAAVLLVAALPASAQASVGTFGYHARGTDRTITNPAPGACLRTPDATRAANETNGPIAVYSSSSCDSLIRILQPRETFLGAFSSAKDLS